MEEVAKRVEVDGIQAWWDLDAKEILGDDAEVGSTKVLEYLGLDDEILDVSLTPNRSDCMAAFAMAKETGAILDRKVTLPDYRGAADIGARHRCA